MIFALKRADVHMRNVARFARVRELCTKWEGTRF